MNQTDPASPSNVVNEEFHSLDWRPSGRGSRGIFAPEAEEAVAAKIRKAANRAGR
ncbi:MAG: hypothetical protein KY475_12665 [Planctomycetes bacterium]|nr:hypothetical protein [Planctomycetota bacterium]